MVPDFAQHNRIEIPAEEINCLSREEGISVLLLADDGVTYGVPLLLGYDADRGRFYFVLLHPGKSSKKTKSAGRTARASSTVWNVPSWDQWKSVIVDGELHQVGDGDWDRVRDALEGSV